MSYPIPNLKGSAIDTLPSQARHIEWPSVIHGDQLKLHRITNETHRFFPLICSWYHLEPKALSEGLKTFTIWGICNEHDQPLGIFRFDQHLSLTSLLQHVPDENLAKELFSQNKTFEISYALDDPYQGQGFGSKAIKAWIDEATRHSFGKCLFAVVDETNKASIRILEKNSFQYLGSYFHNKENRLIYVS